MSNAGIPICANNANLAPLRVHTEGGVPYAVDLIKPGGTQDNYIPPLDRKQVRQINQSIKDVGASICQKDGVLFARFRKTKRFSRVFADKDMVTIPVNGKLGDVPARSRVIADITWGFLTGKIGVVDYLAGTADVPQDSKTLISKLLLKKLTGANGIDRQLPEQIFIEHLSDKLNPRSPTNDPYGWSMLATAYFRAGKTREAIISSRWAMILNPNASYARYILATALHAHYKADPKNRADVQGESARIFGTMEERALNSVAILYGWVSDELNVLEQLLARGADDITLKLNIEALKDILDMAKSKEPEGSTGGSTDPTTFNNTPIAPVGTPFTPAPTPSSPSPSAAYPGSSALEWKGQTMADVGGFDPSEQDLFSTTSTESATILFNETNTTYPTPGANGTVQDTTVTLGAPVPTWFMVPMAARSAGLPVH